MADRETLVQAFIKECGWQGTKRMTLAADASSRSYDRLVDVDGNRSAILMNAPVDIVSNIKTFLKVTEILKNFGFSAPKIYNQDLENGFLLIEDLGDDLFAKACLSDPTLEIPMYQVAIDVLISLHQHSAPLDIPLYDAETYLREARLLTQWYLPAAIGTDVKPAVSAHYDMLINDVCALIPTTNQVLVQRDFHAENLLWLPMRKGVQRVGLLDYQDALVGHPAYDLVSLLEDARRDTSQALRNQMLQYYLEVTGVDPDIFARAYSILGAQRNLKIIGIFARLYLRDGKEQYLDLIPRVWDHLQRDLQHAAVAGLREWVDKNVPEPTMAVITKMRASANEA